MLVASFFVRIATNGTLAEDIADIFTTYGPCDALKASAPATVTGTPAGALDDGSEDVTAYPVAADQWDPAGWKAIASISGSGVNIWAGWFHRKTP